ncbi:MAG: hypothetical protein EAY75_12285 [Bacteroidetes bacterium]|nr:MAG: hypothetical protein EAY75_12285 [Bacteroidota bacterium]
MIGVANANPLYFTTNNIERMRITTDGNVGIGTTDPIGILYVQANPVTETSVRFNSAYVGIRHFYMFNNSTASALVIARFGDGIGGTLFGQSNIQLSAIYTNDLGTNALAVGTKNDIPLILGTNNLERLRITGMGNIGIGTTNPTHAFEVNRNDKGSMFLENPIVEANTTVKIGRGVTAARFGRTTPLHVIAASDRAIVAEGDRFEAIEAFTSSPTQAAGYFSAQGTAKLSVELEGFIKVTGDNKTAFKHTTNAGNINNNWTNLSYANATENDIVIVTHNYSPNNTLFNKALGVFWNTSRWSIYTEDQSAMPANISFNVLVIKQ